MAFQTRIGHCSLAPVVWTPCNTVLALLVPDKRNERCWKVVES